MRRKKERKFIWEQVVLYIHILMYKYIYFYANEAFYFLEIQSQRFTSGKLPLILMFIASGKRGKVDLGSILKFVTGIEKEPLLGFKLHPSVLFTKTNEEYFFVVQ